MLDSVVDPETGEQVELHRSDAVVYEGPPSQATREAWLDVADQYDVRKLVPLWSWTAHQVRLHEKEGYNVGGVVLATNFAIAIALRIAGEVPRESTGAIAQAYAVTPINVGWTELQGSVEGLALAWECVEQEVLADDAMGD